MTVWVMVAIFLARSSHNLLADTGNLKLLLLYHRLNLAPLKFASWLLIKACHLLLFPSIYWPQLPGDSILKSFFREYLYFPLKSSLYHLLIEYNFEFLDARFKPVSSPPPPSSLYSYPLASPQYLDSHFLQLSHLGLASKVFPAIPGRLHVWCWRQSIGPCEYPSELVSC